MKRLFLALALLVSTVVASALEPVQFFTSGQASRVVNFLNNNPEILIYSGPDYPAVYVYTTDVWKERCNGTSYYEVWIYGYDINTNDEVVTPVDLNCIWVNNLGTPVMVAERLGFEYTPCRVNFTWVVPLYRPRPRVPHPHVFHQNFFHQPHLIRHHVHGTPPPPARLHNHNHGYAHGISHGALHHRQVAPPHGNTPHHSPARQTHGDQFAPSRHHEGGRSVAQPSSRSKEMSGGNGRHTQVKSNGAGRHEASQGGRDKRGGRR